MGRRCQVVASLLCAGGTGWSEEVGLELGGSRARNYYFYS